MPGSTQIIVNAHYLADQIEEFCAAYPQVKVLRETELQETGGALTAMAAKNLLPDAPFYVVNGDTYWVDGPSDALRRMADAYDPEKMDAMLLLARTAGALPESGRGDFLWPRDGELKTQDGAGCRPLSLRRRGNRLPRSARRRPFRPVQHEPALGPGARRRQAGCHRA